MATAPAPFPTDSNMTGGGSVPSFPAQSPSQQSPSPFGGGLPAIMKLLTQLEQACKGLAQTLPSLGPLAANTVSNFRMAIPSAVSTDAGQGGQATPNPGVSGPGAGGAAPGLPSPPSQ